MKYGNLTPPKGKFGEKRAEKLNSRFDSRKSNQKSVYSDAEPTTFAEKRADDLYKRYEKAMRERNKMLRGQYASDKPLDEMFAARKDMLDRKIDRMEQELDVLEKQIGQG